MPDNPMRIDSNWGYVVVWEFYVRAGFEQAFERAYGPVGDWIRLFQQAEGYIRTDLNRDIKNPRRYLTLDFWTSRQACDNFREQYLAEYKAIDQRGEAMTEREAEIGGFERVGTGF